VASAWVNGRKDNAKAAIRNADRRALTNAPPSDCPAQCLFTATYQGELKQGIHRPFEFPEDANGGAAHLLLAAIRLIVTRARAQTIVNLFAGWTDRKLLWIARWDPDFSAQSS